MHRSLIALPLVACLLVAACSSAAAPTPQIGTPTATPISSPTTTSTPQPSNTGGMLGEPAQALMDTMKLLGHSFEVSKGPKGKPALTGTHVDGTSAVFVVNDPVTAVLLRGLSSSASMKSFVDFFVMHDRTHVVTWAMNKMDTMSRTGRAGSDSTVLGDSSVATFASEIVGSTLVVTVTLQSN